ncbi:hypothetical protein BZA70DRAFT_233904 [Myxozyma melibiosi]|uniref:F-box domain-containing protein n=1 Tax=Myxozyma melibiosi TaxID=54550 RepID=A0ABR1FDI2_9ASCO
MASQGSDANNPSAVSRIFDQALASTSGSSEQQQQQQPLLGASRFSSNQASANGIQPRPLFPATRFGSASPPSSAYTTPRQLSDSPDDEDEDDEDDDTAADINDDEDDYVKDSLNEFDNLSQADSIVARLPTELVLQIFASYDEPRYLRNVFFVCKAWARCAVELLWYRPNLSSPSVLVRFLKTLKKRDTAFFPYGRYVRKLNLTQVADNLSDPMMISIGESCHELERLSLTACRRLSDASLVPVFEQNPNLVTLDLTNVELLRDPTVLAIAKSCKGLQVLSLVGCKEITDESVIALAKGCPSLRRLKLVDCNLITDASVQAIAQHCRQMLELDIQGCANVTNQLITMAMTELGSLREFKLGFNPQVSDAAFAAFPLDGQLRLDALRVLDLTSCESVTDLAVQRIIDVAPKLRNLVLAKCLFITDRSIGQIVRLGRSLHYLHLGHCANITDMGVSLLVQHCTRIRYIDLGCCSLLTNNAVADLATLPKLRRVGLVKCQNITDAAINCLVQRKSVGLENSLERVHLSYCTGLTLPAIFDLLNSCPRLTHLSLTGIPAFLRPELTQYCREPPQEFNSHQQSVFCVFSGPGVTKLRQHLNQVVRDQHSLYLRMQQQQQQHQQRMAAIGIPDAQGAINPEGHLLQLQQMLQTQQNVAGQNHQFLVGGNGLPDHQHILPQDAEIIQPDAMPQLHHPTFNFNAQPGVGVGIQNLPGFAQQQHEVEEDETMEDAAIDASLD